MNPRDMDGALVYGPIKVRETGAGKAITIPVDVVRSLRIRTGDSMCIVLLDDGFVVSKLEEETADG